MLSRRWRGVESQKIPYGGRRAQRLTGFRAASRPRADRVLAFRQHLVVDLDRGRPTEPPVDRRNSSLPRWWRSCLLTPSPICWIRDIAPVLMRADGGNKLNMSCKTVSTGKDSILGLTARRRLGRRSARLLVDGRVDLASCTSQSVGASGD